ncbi:hypothetical protein HYALB_00008836 [Hymenoscyphus albidus]|uniref:Uncharacterized protein n=1 Tax=Hymenoscyphus albidus TaxID=595503 RepID=A0A9N9LK70_9HELO|nr:hypothetical protein HYALB_00008836 [Hymenoscyphus albidus]
MPFPVPENLDSARDSDSESLSDELSPSNGYFNEGERVPNSIGQDPTMDDDKKPEAKTLIPMPNLQATPSRPLNAASHPAIAQSSSSRSNAAAHSETGLIPELTGHSPISPNYPPVDAMTYGHARSMSGPPPAYTPSPAPSTRYTPSTSSSGLFEEPQPQSQPPSQPQSPWRYSTFSEQPLLETGERGLLHPRTEPESMGGPVDDLLDETTPLSDKYRHYRRLKLLKTIIFSAVAFAVVFAVSTTMFHVSIDKPFKQLPVTERPIDVSEPYCPSATIRVDPVTYEFPLDTDLTVTQTIHDTDALRRMSTVQTSGEIRLRKLDPNSQHGNRPHFTVDVHVSDPGLDVIRNWDEGTRTLQISTPKFARISTPGNPCVSVEVTAWIPEGAEFTNLLIEGITLTLRVLDDVKVKVSGRSKFATITGDVWFPLLEDFSLAPSDKVARSQLPVEIPFEESPVHANQSRDSLASLSLPDSKHTFESRRVFVETTSGTINGIYPLMDFLGLSSQSGDINVGVLPKEVLPEAPTPADLEVQTATGSIQVDLPIANQNNPDFIPPPRNYITNVHSSSGTIEGTYYLGSLGSFKSTSASLDFNILPIVTSGDTEQVDFVSRFETHTVSGTTNITVLDPIFITHLVSPTTPAASSPSSNQDNPPGDSSPYLTVPPLRALFGHPSFTPLPDSTTPSTAMKKLRTLHSKHSSNSANVSVVYPNVWEGSIHAKTISGDISVKGEGLRTIKERTGYAYKEFLARKGVNHGGEGCSAEMSDIAGTLSFRV